jgi:hypothetical protein
MNSSQLTEEEGSSSRQQASHVNRVPGQNNYPRIEGALHRHDTKNSKQLFPEKELHGQSSNFDIHVSVGNLFTFP